MTAVIQMFVGAPSTDACVTRLLKLSTKAPICSFHLGGLLWNDSTVALLLQTGAVTTTIICVTDGRK